MPLYVGSASTTVTNYTPGAASLSVSDIIQRVKRSFGDEADIQINSDDIMRWINDCQREIVVEQNLLQAKATAASVLGQTEYTIPNDTLTLRTVKYNGTKLVPLSISEAENYITDYDNTANYPSGTPTHFWIFANRITLYPKPDTNLAAGLEIYYTRQPTVISALSDIPEVPVVYHNRIVEYCLQQAYELDEDWQAAQAKQQQFRTGLDKLKDQTDWATRDTYPSITSVSEFDY